MKTDQAPCNLLGGNSFFCEMLSFYNEVEYFVIVDVSTERAFSSKSSPGPIMCHLDV